MRLYFCKYIGTGAEDDQYRVTIYDYLTQSTIDQSRFYDMRANAAIKNGYALIAAPTTDAEHALILLDPLCKFTSIVDGAGIPQDILANSSIGQTLGWMSSRKIDTQGLSINSPPIDLLRRVFPTAA